MQALQVYYDGCLGLAVRKFNEVLAKDPTNIVAAQKRQKAKNILESINKAVKAEKRNNFPLAMGRYKKAMEVDKTNNMSMAILHFNVARMRHKIEGADKALVDLDLAICFNPTYHSALVLRGQYYVELNQLQNAVESYMAAEKVSSTKELKKCLDDAKYNLKFQSLRLYTFLGVKLNAGKRGIDAAVDRKKKEPQADISKLNSAAYTLKLCADAE